MTDKSLERSSKKEKVNNENVPIIRYPEFKENWKQRKLKDVCTVTMGQSPSSSNYTDNSEDTILIQGNQDLVNGKISPRTYTTEITKKSFPNDIILTVRAPVGDIAINDYEVCIGRGVCSLSNMDNNKFIYYYLQYLSSKHIWNKYSQGSTFESINSNDIKSMKINIPSLDEQIKISNLFDVLDQKITFMEKKYQKLLSYAYSLKFELFKGNIVSKFELVPLKDLINYSSSNLSLNKLEDNTGCFPLYGADGFVKNIDFFDKDEEYISIVKDGNGVGRLNFNNKKTSVVGTMGYLTLKEENNLRFIYYAMSLLSLNKYIIGSTIPHIYFKDFSKEKIYLPTMTIQNKVVDIMLSLDTKIFKLNNEIELNKEFKRFLLSKMFC